ncbi:hypothetical protein BG004_005777 [Podila humilis]|nr:hypothetical protein BG004_005777 [Podila humilis]
MGHSRMSRSRSSLGRRNSQQNDIFCEKCNGHQRVVYQLLSNYIPGEDDDLYQDYYDNADNYRRQLEERYPLACSQCLDKVQRALSKQNYSFKTNILNTTLSKSRGDRISRTRTFPSRRWLVAGCCFLASNSALMIINTCGIFGPHILPSMGTFNALKYPSNMAGTLTPGIIAKAATKFNIMGLWPRAATFGSLLNSPTDDEDSGVVLFLVILITIIGASWDRLLFVQQRSPQKRIKEFGYYRRARITYFAAIAIQLFYLTAGSLWADRSVVMHLVFLVLHSSALVAVIQGRVIQDPIALKLHSRSNTPEGHSRPVSPTSSHRSKDTNARQYQQDNNPFSSSPQPQSQHHSRENRPNVKESSRHTFQPSSLDFTNSRPGSPNTDQIDWSPRKATPPVSGQLPAQFGMYRDSNFSRQYDDASASLGTSFAAVAATDKPQSFQERLQAQSTDNKFRSRAYEPSPLVAPDLMANLSRANMSLGEMFGFPSAKFQPPENHFAHRSVTKESSIQKSDPWSHRKDSESEPEDDFPSRRTTRFGQSRVNGRMDMDFQDDDEVENKHRFKSYSNRNQYDNDADDVFSQFRSMGSFGSKSGMTIDGREAFAAQTYFPPEPETGLEDNFLGVVKIVDDYVPPSQTPRTIAGRNLMMKKQKAPFWMALIVLTRIIVGLDGSEIEHWMWPWIQLVSKGLFVGAVLHAAVFWIVDVYQTIVTPAQTGKPGKSSKEKRNTTKDPFAPTVLHAAISCILLVVLVSRSVGVVSVMVKMILSKMTAQDSSNDNNDWVLDFDQRRRQAVLNEDEIMDWFPSVSEKLFSGMDWPVAVDTTTNTTTAAAAAGWAHDGLIVVFLAMLYVLRAGPVGPQQRTPTTTDKDGAKGQKNTIAASMGMSMSKSNKVKRQ